MTHLTLIACTLLAQAAAAKEAPRASAAAAPKVHKIAVGGEGGWDYLTVDPDAHRLYVARGNRVVVLDTEKEAVVGELADTPGVHGVAVVPELGKGFTSNGSDSSVTVFDLKTLKPTGKIKASGVPDAILYDPASRRVVTFNHRTDDATVIDPAKEAVTGTIAFKAEPEAAVADGKGRMFVNLRSTSEVAEFDPVSLKILNRFPLSPGVRPNGLAMDVKNRRLFSGCNGNSKMVVMDADKGTILGTPEIGRASDGCAFDPEKGLAYSSNGGDGTITAVGEASPGKFEVMATIPTQAGARTIALDPKSHRLYLSAATPAPAPAGEAVPKKGARRGMVPGSFVIVVVGD